MLGRLLGFVREILLSRMLGTGSQADIAVLVLTVPSFLLDLMIGGALGAALVPAFVRSVGSGQGPQFYRRIITFVGVGSCLATLVFAVGSPAIVAAFAPGMAGEDRQRCAQLLRIGFLSIPLTAMSAVAQAYLHAHGAFRMASLGTAFYNACLLCPLLLADISSLVPWLAIAVVAAALVRYMMIASAASAVGPLRSLQSVTAPDPLLWRRYMQALIAGGGIVALPVIARSFASTVGEGGITIINLASKIIELPLGSCLTVLSVVLLPKFSELFTRGKESEKVAVSLFRRSISITLAVALPITAGLIGFGDRLATILFSGSVIDPQASVAIGSLIRLLACGVPALALVVLAQAVLSAKRDMASQVWASMLGMAGLVAGGIACMVGAGLPAIAWGWVAGSWLMLAWHAACLRRHGVAFGSLISRPANAFAVLSTAIVTWVAWSVASAAYVGDFAAVIIMAAGAATASLIGAIVLGVFSRDGGTSGAGAETSI